MATTPSSAGRSFSAEVLSRILGILHREGAVNKTNLAGKTRLNYLTCIKYLELLKSLGFVQTRNDDDTGGERISISEVGIRFNTNLQAYLQKTNAIDASDYDFIGTNDVADFIKEEIASDVVASSPENNGNKVYKVMLVDDEKDILFTYQLFLSEAGYEVRVFSDPGEALRQFALSPTAYQLVITDIRMSSLNGLHLYHGIRTVNQNIKIIFLSDLDSAEELVSILPGLNKEFVLKKPVNREIFTKTVDLAMRRKG